jgi:hypothetical protein
VMFVLCVFVDVFGSCYVVVVVVVCCCCLFLICYILW